MTAETLQNDEHFCRKILFRTLLIWSVVWFLVPMLTIPGVFFDVAENIEWGRYWQFGYDKHPFVSMWITRFFYDLTGSTWIMFVLCQISISASVVCTWLLARKMLKPLSALAAALLLLTLQYFSSWALEFNNDVIAISVWSAAYLFFYNALQKQKILDWLLAAFFCFLAIMTKYYALVLIVSLGLILLITPEGRRSFRRPGLYLAAILFLLLIAPNIQYLFDYDFAPFKYAMQGSGSKETRGFFARRLINCLYFFRTLLERTGYLILICLLFFRKRESKPELSDFNRKFILVTTFGPLLLTFLVPFLAGGHIKDTWLASCFNTAGIFVMLFWNPIMNRKKIKAILYAVCVFAVAMIFAMGVTKLYIGAYSKKGSRCPYENYPGQKIADKATALWRAKYGTRMEYVIATRRDGCFMALHSPDNPHAFYLANPRISNWIDTEDVRRKGALVIWEITRKDKPDYQPDWLKRVKNPVFAGTYVFDRITAGWVHRLVGKPLRTVTISVAFLPPEKALPAEKIKNGIEKTPKQ